MFVIQDFTKLTNNAGRYQKLATFQRLKLGVRIGIFADKDDDLRRLLHLPQQTFRTTHPDTVAAALEVRGVNIIGNDVA